MSIEKSVSLVIPPPTAASRTVRPKHAPRALFEAHVVKRALREAFVKLDPRIVARNPVMFVVEVGSAVTTYLFIRGLVSGASDTLFVGQVTLWLWFTVLFANFAEAMAEGRGKAQADSLRKAKTDTQARRLVSGREERIPAPQLAKGDLFVCEAGDVIAADGEIIEGIASVDESAST
ncbi:MAG: potassium-transporting ATPase subunit B, partial [Polyangiales bacterium]